MKKKKNDSSEQFPWYFKENKIGKNSGVNPSLLNYLDEKLKVEYEELLVDEKTSGIKKNDN